MSVSLRIALRYLFSYSKQTVINRINAIALLVVVVAAAALMIVLSAFAGLKDFGLAFTQSLNPTYRVIPAEGKTLQIDSIVLGQIGQIKGVSKAVPVVEEKIFMSFEEKNQVGYLKGVGPDYTNVVPADSLIVVGQWPVFEQAKAVVGYGTAVALGLGVFDFDAALQLTFPKQEKQGLFKSPSMQTASVYVVGLYQVSEDLDNKYVFTDLQFAHDFLGLHKNQYTALEIASDQTSLRVTLEEKIEALLKQPVVVEDQQTMNAAFYKMLNTENLAVYLIFTLVMIVALFNVIGALIMMRLDKRPQARVLLAMGLLPQQLQKIFFILGGLLSGIGGVLGIFVAVLLILIQQNAPFLYVPGMRLPYPVMLHLQDIALVLLTVVVFGGAASWWATQDVAKSAREIYTKE